MDEYYRMAQVGLLAEDARVELIEGEIFDRSRRGGIVSRLTHLRSRCQETPQPSAVPRRQRRYEGAIVLCLR